MAANLRSSMINKNVPQVKICEEEDVPEVDMTESSRELYDD